MGWSVLHGTSNLNVQILRFRLRAGDGTGVAEATRERTGLS